MGKVGVRLGLGVLTLAPESGYVPLVGGPSAQGGFGNGNVSPWVRVSSGGGCPRP